MTTPTTIRSLTLRPGSPPVLCSLRTDSTGKTHTHTLYEHSRYSLTDIRRLADGGLACETTGGIIFHIPEKEIPNLCIQVITTTTLTVGDLKAGSFWGNRGI